MTTPPTGSGELDLSSQALTRLRRLALDSPSEHLPELARFLRLRASALSRSRPEEALQLYRESLGVYRELATDEPSKYLDEQASCLGSLGSTLFILGRCSESIDSLREAVEIWRPLAASQPALYSRELSGAVRSLLWALRASRQFEEAVAIAREVVTEARESGQGEHLAASLQELGLALAAAGHLEAAVAPAREAVAVRREISRHKRDAWTRGELAISLMELGYRLALVGRFDSLAVMPHVLWIRISQLERKRLASQMNELAGEAFFWAEFPFQLVIRNLQRSLEVVAGSKVWHRLPRRMQQRGLDFLRWRPTDPSAAWCQPRPLGWTPRQPFAVGGTGRSWSRWLGMLKL